MYSYKQLKTIDVLVFRELMRVFTEVFAEQAYQGAPPDDHYVEKFLSETSHIVLVAMDEGGAVVGGLVAYELKKFEQARSEIYIYDLAVLASHQRKGVATGLIETLKTIGKKQNAYVIFVQADEEDDGAIAFYRSISTSEIKAHHFDIEISK